MKPTGNWAESKRFYDTKNGIYGLKKEIGITSNPPYLALFFQDGEAAAQHDFLIHQKYTNIYNKYLKITNQDIEKDESLKTREYWDLLGDKGYQGNVAGQKYTKITPMKIYSTSKNLQESQSENKKKARVRVFVECFFGRIYQNWKLATFFKYDLAHFDVDLNNIILLTNEDIISNCQLNSEDYVFYRKYISSLELEKNKKKKRREKTYEQFKARQKKLQEEYLNPNKRQYEEDEEGEEGEEQEQHLLEKSNQKISEDTQELFN